MQEEGSRACTFVLVLAAMVAGAALVLNKTRDGGGGTGGSQQSYKLGHVP